MNSCCVRVLNGYVWARFRDITLGLQMNKFIGLTRPFGAVVVLLIGLSACTSTPPDTAVYRPDPVAYPSPDTAAHRPTPSYRRYIAERSFVVLHAPNAGAEEVGRVAAGDAINAWMEDGKDNWTRIHNENGKVGYIFGTPLRRGD